jgi:hypothetical protein
MLAKVCSAAVNGIDAYPVEVEVNAAFGDTLKVIVVNNSPNPLEAAFFQAIAEVSCLFRDVPAVFH